MITLSKEIYAEDPTQRIIDAGAGWGAGQMLKAVDLFFIGLKISENNGWELICKRIP